MEFFRNSWDEVLADVFESSKFEQLMQRVFDEYKTKTVYPPQNKVFSAFKLTPYDKVRVVILGQDPYHGAGQAHGVSFSVMPNVACPPSLKNMYKEIENELGVKMSGSGCLVPWAKQGVFLLNSVLTVVANTPGSHKEIGWQWFTDQVIKKLSDRKEPIVFLLWGSYAISKRALIDTKKHVVLTCPHPSPLSAYSGFFGCGHFAKTNEILKSWGEQPIDWKI